MDEDARRLCFSPEFQRLRYVRLCNINSLYLMGASEPKRFEHCVGTYHLAEVWSRARGLARGQAAVVKAAALLHDLLTGPFGHSFQYVMEDNPFDQRFEHADLASGTAATFLQAARAAAHFAGRPFASRALLGGSADQVYAAIRGEGPFGPMISGTLDLDNLDNVVRLAFHMGICTDADRALPARLVPLLCVHQHGLAAHEGAHDLMVRWFEIRRQLYTYLLLDRGEFAAKAMLTFSIEAAAEADLLAPSDWTLTDDALLDELESRSVGQHQAVGQVIKRLRLGDLFECLGVWQSEETSAYGRLNESLTKRDMERMVEKRAALAGGSRFRICLHYVLDRRKTCRSLCYHDVARGVERSIGYDSNTLLVGAFVTNARSGGLTKPERQRLGEVAWRVLAEAGLGSLPAAPEPLAASEATNDLLV